MTDTLSMKIGFDLDKIFINYPPLVPEAIIDKLYIKKANGTLEYRIPSFPEQYIRRISHFPLFRPAIKENIDFLRTIPRQGNKLYLISSRFGFLKEQTQAILERYGLAKLFDGLYFNYENKQPHLFKEEMLKKLKLDVYVDDDVHLLRFLAKKNRETKFFWLNHHNGHVEDFKNLTAISHLPEIFK